jgi:hypothetical protein
MSHMAKEEDGEQMRKTSGKKETEGWKILVVEQST